MIHEPAELSNRALRFLREGSVALGQSEPGVTLDTTGLTPDALDLAAMYQIVAGYRWDYEGRTLKVAGGPLRGSILLGCGSNPRLRESRNGVIMFRAARHEHAQCDIVVSEHGEFGCSWGDEFHLLFNSVASFIEDCAIWNELRGWHYVARLDGDFDRVLDVLGEITRQEIKLEESAAWRIGDNIAIASYPYLNPARSVNNQTAILIRDKEKVLKMFQFLSMNGIKIPGDPSRIVDAVGW